MYKKEERKTEISSMESCKGGFFFAVLIPRKTLTFLRDATARGGEKLRYFLSSGLPRWSFHIFSASPYRVPPFITRSRRRPRQGESQLGTKKAGSRRQEEQSQKLAGFVLGDVPRAVCLARRFLGPPALAPHRFIRARRLLLHYFFSAFACSWRYVYTSSTSREASYQAKTENPWTDVYVRTHAAALRLLPVRNGFPLLA